MQSTETVCKGVNQMVHTFRITKEQYSLGTYCRLQGLQREVLTVSVVSSHLSFGISSVSQAELWDKLWRTLEETRKKLGPLEWLRLFEG